MGTTTAIRVGRRLHDGATPEVGHVDNVFDRKSKIPSSERVFVLGVIERPLDGAQAEKMLEFVEPFTGRQCWTRPTRNHNKLRVASHVTCTEYNGRLMQY